jgi:hypothetical protein
MANLKMTIERASAFNGLDVLVAIDEGLFEAEGLDLQLGPPSPAASLGRRTENGTLLAPQTSQGILLDRGEAAMFQG